MIRATAEVGLGPREAEPRSIAAVPAGLSLVEVVVAMLILTAGILATAVTTGTAFSQLQRTDAAAERLAAVQIVVEELRAADYDTIVTRAEAVARTVGDYRIWWTVRAMGNVKEIEIISEGPAVVPGEGRIDAQRETLMTSIARP